MSIELIAACCLIFSAFTTAFGAGRRYLPTLANRENPTSLILLSIAALAQGYAAIYLRRRPKLGPEE